MRRLDETEVVEIVEPDIGLVLDALEDAMVFRDGRASAIANAVRRSSRKFPGLGAQDGSAAEADRAKARQYAALAARLKARRSE